MEPATPFDWHRMFIGDEPALYLLEIVFRTFFIYGYAVVMLRYLGKRGQRNLSTFQNVVIVALGSATGDSMFYPGVSILYACVVITTIVGLGRLIQELQLRMQPFNAFLQGKPLMMVRNGKVVQEAMGEARLRPDEFMAMLRDQGIRHTGEVEFAFLERSGLLSVYRYEPEDRVSGESTFPNFMSRNNPSDMKL